MQKNFLCLAAALCLLAAQANMACAQEQETAVYRIAAIKWQYEPLAKTAAFYEENRARYAPNSSLRFRLPWQTRGLPDKQAVKLLGPDYTDEIALDESRSFALPPLRSGRESDTAIVVDGYFNKGSYLPVPVVRTENLAPHMLRFGDARLSCRTLAQYVRASKMSWNILFGTLKAFSLDACADKQNGFAVKMPMDFNKVSWMVGDKVVKVEALPSASREFKVPIGDEAITDDTLLAFELVPVAGDEANKGGH
jgi:hypothetical protein